MKHLKIALMALLVVAGLSNVNAQDENNPWAISVGVNAVDFHPTNRPGNETETLGISSGWYDEFFNATAHYNIIPSISRVSVGRYLADGFSFTVSGNLNKITKVGNGPITPEYNPGNWTFLGLDGDIRYDLNKIIGDTKWFDPYVSVGGGYTWIDWTGNGTLNGGLGTNLWFSDNVGINLQSAYKHSFDNSTNLKKAQHFQHSAGLVFKFGGKDTDGDGIYDKDDACPEVFGLEAFNGCPDSDGDGIKDSEDACPEVFGLATLNGCPDRDGDGIADAKDACPDVAGLKSMNGCPDADGDGITDAKDKCPKEAGPAANDGCPWGDKDGDGITDNLDKCPEVAGVKSNNGCPEVVVAPAPAVPDVQTITELDNLARTVLFNSGKSSFTPETYAILDRIADLISGFPSAKFHIGGHTDSVGSASLNQRLSERRAAAVMAYLQGKVGNTFTSAGYGETRPVATNSTRTGRKQNRRVEIKLVR